MGKSLIRILLEIKFVGFTVKKFSVYVIVLL